jgi:hypothetical protein
MHILMDYLVEQMGEEAADNWLEARFPDGSRATWKDMAVAIDYKLGELNHARLPKETEAEHRLEVGSVRYAGAL